jgi:cephalosporin-C deacetylase-like acetyl esterase
MIRRNSIDKSIVVRLVVGCWLWLLPAGNGLLGADRETRANRLPETTPWDVQQLFEAPAMQWLEQDEPVHSLFYQGEPYGGQATRVFAYYANPRTLGNESDAEKKYPAVVLVHGGGGTAFREWVELWAKKGYAAIAMDLAGHQPIEGMNPHHRENRQRLADGGPNQSDQEKFFSIDDPPAEQWPYHAVAAVVRAHSLIRGFPEVDSQRTAITGISWGGYLTCIAAGVDSRFQAAAPIYGCGFLHENSAWLSRFERMTADQRARWIQLWDPSRYLPAVSMPILFVNGTNDSSYPLDSYMKSFDAVPGPKQLCITVNMPHSHPAGWAPSEIARFIDHHLRGGEPLAQLGELHRQQDELVFPVKTTVELEKAELHVTRDHGPINERTWSSTPARLDGESIRLGDPGRDVTAWLITVTDDLGDVVSSRVYFSERAAKD